jgi:hypothetical protein
MAYSPLDDAMTGDLSQAQSYLNDYTKNTYGQTLNDQQWQQLGGAIGYTGGNVTGSQVNQAAGLIDQYAGSLGWSPTQQQPAPSAPAPAPAPTAQPAAGPDAAGVQQFQTWAQQTYGREATPEELQQIANQIGYTGGAISPEMMQQAQQVAAQIAASYGAQPIAPATPAPAAAPTLPQQQAQTQSQVQTTLQELLGAGTEQIDPNSEENRLQRGAFLRGQQRAMERARLGAAERANQSGATGALDGDINRMNLTAAQQSGDFEAGLVRQELEGQRERLMQALSIAAQQGDRQAQLALQDKLATLDATLRREGYSLQEKLGRGQLGLGLLEAQLRDRQANNALGFNYAQLGNQSNTSLMQSIIQGLMSGGGV